jgi:hypothetical protein
MTLASILLVSVLSALPCVEHFPGEFIPPQSESTPDQPLTASKQAQNSAGASSAGTVGQTGEKTPTGAQQSTSSQTDAPNKKKRKKKLPVNCDDSAAQNVAPKSATSKATTDAAGKGSSLKSSGNCPPTKVIVRQGSTTEPSIQVVGGAEGSQASDERNTAIKMLETTEANLKKIEGTQLDSNQQDMVKQVHQFMDQSKSASSNGNLDQARTLAWKAQLLSEELLKPQK